MVAQTIERVDVRPTEHTDMPAGLTPGEQSAYVRGYSRGCLTYVRKHGAPAVSLDGPAPAAGTPERRALAAQLREETTAHMIARQDTAHRAGMSALRKYRKTHGIETPAAPRTRKPAARKLAAVPDQDTTTPAPVVEEQPADVEPVAPVVRLVPGPLEPEETTEQPTEEQRPHRTRRAARRQLAEEMRARGEDPTDAAAWAAAKTAAGIR